VILKRFYEDALAQASFLIGCAETGESIVIDPNRDADAYVLAARAERLRITAVTETHIHADYVSGSRELAARTGARVVLSDEGGADWRYGYAGEPNVTLVRHGDTIRAGRVRLDVIRTPGHTPEHIAFIITDEASTDRPHGVFTGDFVFVGDVGRPDLLERAVQVQGTMERGARTLFRALQEFKHLPGHLMLWPSHGAGSACGKSLGGVPVSTLAYESMANWGLREGDEERFVSEVLAGQPEPPRYFKEMKRMNQQGPPVLNGFWMPPRIDGAAVLAALAEGQPVVDVRSHADFGRGYVPGVLNIPAGRAFLSWAGWLLPYDRPVLLIAPDEQTVAVCVRALALIGIDRVGGWAGTREVLDRWTESGAALETVAQTSAREAFERAQRGEIVMLDVRGQAEYDAGHVPGALHVTLGYLTERAADLPRDRLLGVHCAGGSRSPIAVSVLRRLGFTRLLNIPGGFSEHAAAGLPVEREETRIAAH
jgi:hydroxyacylglutathione hydrolase